MTPPDRQPGADDAPAGAPPARPPAKKRPQPKSPRRRARELALQGLYRWLIAGGEPAAVEADLRDQDGFDKADREHFDALLRGSIEQAAALDAQISVKPTQLGLDLDAAQVRDMAVAAEVATHVAGQRTDIGALAAFDLEEGIACRRRGDQLKPTDFDFARGDLDSCAVAGQIIGALTGDLHGRELRRHLHDDAGVSRQQRLDIFG